MGNLKLFVIAILAVGIFSLGCATVSRTSGDLDAEQKEALLRSRAMEMWNAQIVGDRFAMYELYDPFFRARVRKGQFADKELAYIKYYNPEVYAVHIEGNVAQVRIKMEFEVKGLVLKSGKVHDEPRKENITNETWLFIDGTWYRQFIDYITDSTFAKY
jgi:uncharacterized protein YchJ